MADEKKENNEAPKPTKPAVKVPKPATKVAKPAAKVVKAAKLSGTKIKNNHKSDLALPKGVFIRKGEEVEVSPEVWKHLSNHDVIKSWISADVISIESNESDDATETGEEDL